MSDASISTALLVIASATIGAGGSIVAQVIGGYFTGKRDARRLVFDASNSQREDERLRQATFRDDKRMAFVKLLQLARARLDLVGKCAGVFGDEYLSDAVEIARTADEWWSAWWATLLEVSLIAPSVEPEILIFHGDLGLWEDQVQDGLDDDSQQYFDALQKKFDLIKESMRSNIGTPK